MSEENQFSPMLNCPICFKTFGRQAETERHMKIHTKEKPFKCLHSSCDKYFSRRDNMMQHYHCHSSGGYIAKREDKVKKYKELKKQIMAANSHSQTNPIHFSSSSSSSSSFATTTTTNPVFQPIQITSAFSPVNFSSSPLSKQLSLPSVSVSVPQIHIHSSSPFNSSFTPFTPSPTPTIRQDVNFVIKPIPTFASYKTAESPTPQNLTQPKPCLPPVRLLFAGQLGF